MRNIWEYTIKVNEVKGNDSNVRGFATVVFDDSFKVTNITILENREKNQLFVSMPRYKSNEVEREKQKEKSQNKVISKQEGRLR